MTILLIPEGRGSPTIYANHLYSNTSLYGCLETPPQHIVPYTVSSPLTSYPEAIKICGDIRRHPNELWHFPFQHYAKFANIAKHSITTVHDLWWVDDPYRKSRDSNLRDRLYRHMDIRGIQCTTHITTPSEFSKRQIIDAGWRTADDITVVYNGVDHEIYKPQTIDPACPYTGYILYVGSEQPRKNMDTMLKVLYELRRVRRLPIKLIKVGRPETIEFRQNTIRTMQNLGLTDRDVIWFNHVPERELVSLYNGAICYISTSWQEGFDLPVMEAMACGCPVVVSDTGAHPELIGGRGIPVENATAYAEVIQNYYEDTDLRNKVGTRLYERSKDFSWSYTGQNMLKVYRKVTDEY